MKKLRNKKTGAIGDLLGTFNAVPFIGIAIDYHDGNPVKYEYNSIAELNEEWEDYDPDEPLIEHEIVRKALKWWAVSNGITGDASLLFIGDANGFTCENQYISFDSAVYDMSEKLISGNTYDLEELCGEEGE